MTKDEALKLALEYMNERLENHDIKFMRHPATEAERDIILADIKEVKEALALTSTKCEEQPAHCRCAACMNGTLHASDCAVHNAPAYPAGPCDCGAAQEPVDLKEQARKGCGNCSYQNCEYPDCLNRKAKLKEKNT